LTEFSVLGFFQKLNQKFNASLFGTRASHISSGSGSKSHRKIYSKTESPLTVYLI